MENYFIDSTSFFGLKGILKRRNFIINFLKIEIIKNLVVTTPLFYLMIINPDMIKIVSSGVMPLWFNCYYALVGLILLSLFYPSITRRVRDILGINDDNKINLISATLAVFLYMNYTPMGSIFIAKWLVFFILAVLLIQPGKISSERPHSEWLKFNWASFLGTWIWGLYNKTCKPMWIIPLYLTFAWFPYQIICGICGNEWAKEKNDNIELEEFKKQQKTQTKVMFALIPILGLVFAILLGFVIEGMYALTVKINPEYPVKIKKVLLNVEGRAIESSFQKIELNDSGYKFYVEPNVWESVPKTSLFNSAITYVYMQKSVDYYSPKQMMDNLQLAKNTKIYSTFDNFVLAEFNPDMEKLKASYKKGETTKDYSEFLINWRKGFKIYENKD